MLNIRKLSFVFLLATAAAAQNASESTTTPTPNFIKAQANDSSSKRARDILNQMIQKLGGEAYLNVQDMEQEGRSYSYYQGRPNSVGVLFWRFTKFPDKDRVELTKQRDVTQINIGDKGYEITYKGTAFQEADQLADYNRRRRHSLETILRIWLQNPKTALFHDGPAIAEQKHCDSISILSEDNDSVTLFVDSRTFLPVKKLFQYRNAMDRLKDEEGEIFDNFRPIQGVLTAHSILRSHNGDTTNQRFLTAVRYNIGIPDSKFAVSEPYVLPKDKPNK